MVVGPVCRTTPSVVKYWHFPFVLVCPVCIITKSKLTWWWAFLLLLFFLFFVCLFYLSGRCCIAGHDVALLCWISCLGIQSILQNQSWTCAHLWKTLKSMFSMDWWLFASALLLIAQHNLTQKTFVFKAKWLLWLNKVLQNWSFKCTESSLKMSCELFLCGNHTKQNEL